MIQKTAIVGMGALGTLYGGIISRALGRDAVEFIVDGERFERYKSQTTTINGAPVDFKIVRAENAAPAELIIVAVKFRGLESALDTMKNCVGDNTIILSVLNGISSEKIIAKRYGPERVLYTVAMGMSARKLGSDLQCPEPGNLHIGSVSDAQKPYLDSVCEFFRHIDMPHIVEKNIIHRLWAKFMLNVGVNLITAAYGADNGAVLGSQALFNTMLDAMRETTALANAEGIALTDADIEEAVDTIKSLAPKSIPSTAQDIIAKRPTEVDMLAGTVIEMSRKHGLKTPVNEDLYRRIKKLEAEYS